MKMKHKLILPISIFVFLAFIVLLVPSLISNINNSRELALATLANNIEFQLENALNKHFPKGINDDSINIYCHLLNLEYMSTNSNGEKIFSFLSSPYDSTFLSTYDNNYLKKNFIIYYYGNGNFDVKKLRTLKGS